MPIRAVSRSRAASGGPGRFRGLPFAAICVLVGAVAALHGAEVIDRILVRVDSHVVTQGALDHRVLQKVRESGKALSEAQLLETRKAVMEELVNESLLEDRARELELVATETEVEDYVKRHKEQNLVKTDEEFVLALAGNGLTMDELREQLRHSLTIQRVVGREVYSKIDLGDDVLRQAYEREKETWRAPEQARISEILIPRGEGGAGEAKVREVLQKADAGATFEGLVPLYSSGGTRDRAGDLGFVSRGELNPAIEKVVFSLPVGAVSHPIGTSFGWHIVKVLDRRPAALRPFAEVKAEVLKKEQDRRFPQKLAEYLDRLKREATIEVSAEAAPFYAPPARGLPAPSAASQPKPAE